MTVIADEFAAEVGNKFGCGEERGDVFGTSKHDFRSVKIEEVLCSA